MTEELIERRARLAARVQASIRNHPAVKAIRFVEVLETELGEAVDVGVVLRSASSLREVQGMLYWTFPGLDLRVVLEEAPQAAAGGPNR